MDKYEANRLLASILLAILICLAISNLVHVIYKTKVLPKHRGFSLITTEGSSLASTSTTEIIDIAALMAKASIERGQQLAKKCIGCHTFEQGEQHKIGPNLWGVLGRAKAGLTNYNYSIALKDKDGIWNYQDLFVFLQKPQELVPGTKMFFLGFENPQAAADVIAYLGTKINALKLSP